MRREEICLFYTAIVTMSVVAGCSSSDDCDQAIGIELSCSDAVTGAPIGNATTVVNGDATQQLQVGCTRTALDAAISECDYVGPTTAGTYTITFAAPGYETQTVTDTLTPSGSNGCGYVTESLHQVSLIPIDAGTTDGG
jgi:hypothetical protein